MLSMGGLLGVRQHCGAYKHGVRSMLSMVDIV